MFHVGFSLFPDASLLSEAALKYFECIQNRSSYGSVAQYRRSPNSEHYIYKANTKSNYDSHIILTGSGRFCYNNKADLIRVSISGKTSGTFEIMTDQNNFNGQGGNFSFFDKMGAQKEKHPLIGLKYLKFVQIQYVLYSFVETM